MKRPSRHESARQLADDIMNGKDLPRGTHTNTRLVMPDRLATATTTSCAICGATLVGRQKTFCYGHWDYLAVPIDASSDPEQFVLFLAEMFDNLRVEHVQRHWLAVINGHSRCEVCEMLTSNVERLVTADDRVLKQHTVCPDHQSARRPALDNVK